jgi:predicted signal transduction protein with EAL and GGDEF domain
VKTRLEVRHDDSLARDAVGQLLHEFGVDEHCIAQLNTLGWAIAEHAPQMVALVKRDSVLSHAQDAFQRPLPATGMSGAQRALLDTIMSGALTSERLRALLLRWIANAVPEGSSDLVRFDCQRLQAHLRAGAIKVFAGDWGGCERTLDAVERLTFLQLAVLTWHADNTVAARRRGEQPDYTPLMGALAELIEARKKDGRGLAVLVIECGLVGRLDGLWGYAIGDSARARLAQRLSTGLLRPLDHLGELGRDEFACVLSTLAGPGVALLAAQKALRVLASALTVGDTDVYARPAIGIAIFPDHGDSATALLLRAKIACQAARERSERVSVYSDREESPRIQTFEYESKLRAAIDQSRLELVYQPQFDPRTRRIMGCEALLRWEDSELGVVPPHRAIAVAESAGLVNEVTWWVLNNAIRQGAEFRARGLDIGVSVNLSPNNLREPDLPDFVDRGLRTWGLPAERLVIEITETAVLGAPELVVESLERLKALGVRLSIDDFGTGYSSMSYLAMMPLDEMKIDLSFVRRMLDVPQHERIVRSMIDLGHSLGITVIAEGVESEPVAQRLAELGCDRIQGYLMSRPISAGDLVRDYGPAQN